MNNLESLISQTEKMYLFLNLAIIKKPLLYENFYIITLSLSLYHITLSAICTVVKNNIFLDPQWFRRMHLVDKIKQKYVLSFIIKCNSIFLLNIQVFCSLIM